MVGDIANLGAALSAAGLDPTTMVVIAAVKQALVLQMLAGPKFNYMILPTAALPTGSVMAVVPDAIGVMFEGEPQIETSTQTAIHFEDVAPAQIGTPGRNVVAAPVRSPFQSDVLAIKCRARATWCVCSPGGVQTVVGTTW